MKNINGNQYLCNQSYHPETFSVQKNACAWEPYRDPFSFFLFFSSFLLPKHRFVVDCSQPREESKKHTRCLSFRVCSEHESRPQHDREDCFLRSFFSTPGKTFFLVSEIIRARCAHKYSCVSEGGFHWPPAAQDLSCVYTHAGSPPCKALENLQVPSMENSTRR